MNRYNMQWLSCAVIVVFSVFILCNISVCLLPTFNTSDFYSTFQQFLISRNYLNSIILNSTETSILDGIIQIKNNRFTQWWKYFFYYAILYTNISLLSNAELILCQFLFLASRANRHIPIIALHIGGHGPPEKILMTY